MTAMLAWFAQHVGRRGGTLLFLALLDASMTFALVSVPPETLATGAYVGARTLAPLSYWAGVWALIGLVCFVQAFARKDVWAFTLAATVKVVWALTYLVSWLFLDSPRGWVNAAVWAAFGAFVLLISGWEENSGPDSSGHVQRDPLVGVGNSGAHPADGSGTGLPAGDESNTGGRR